MRNYVAPAIFVASCVIIFVLYNNSVSKKFDNVMTNLVQTQMDRTQYAPPSAAPQRVKLTKGQDVLNELRKRSVTNDLSSVDVNAMTEPDITYTIHSYLDNHNIICQRTLRMGSVGDGGWEVCDDPDVRPEPPCIVYSFGINNDFSFDDEMSKYYGCHVYSFDPSMGVTSHNRSNLVHFYNWGLGGKTEVVQRTITKRRKQLQVEWQMYTLADIKKKLGHTVVDVIKMDIELSEWPMFENCAGTHVLDSVKQIFLEVHLFDFQDFKNRLITLQKVEKEGYKKYLSHKNHICYIIEKDLPINKTKCYEVYYMRRP